MATPSNGSLLRRFGPEAVNEVIELGWRDEEKVSARTLQMALFYELLTTLQQGNGGRRSGRAVGTAIGAGIAVLLAAGAVLGRIA